MLTIIEGVKGMSPDDIDEIALAVFDLFVDMGYSPDENDEWDQLKDLLYNKLDPFITRDRNYN
jgi:hypothetical protein